MAICDSATLSSVAKPAAMACMSGTEPAMSLGRSAPLPSAILIGKAKLSSTSGTGVTDGESEAVLVLEGVCVRVAVGVCVGEADSETVVVGVFEAVIEMVLDGEGVMDGVTLGEADGGVMQTFATGS